MLKQDLTLQVMNWKGHYQKERTKSCLLNERQIRWEN